MIEAISVASDCSNRCTVNVKFNGIRTIIKCTSYMIPLIFNYGSGVVKLCIRTAFFFEVKSVGRGARFKLIIAVFGNEPVDRIIKVEFHPASDCDVGLIERVVMRDIKTSALTFEINGGTLRAVDCYLF